MDLEALNQILQQLQVANREFMTQMINENNKLLADTLKKENQSIPNFRNFNKLVDKWPTYFLQLEQHFVANNVQDEDTKRACLLSWIGSDSLELLQKNYGDKVKEKTFKELIEKLNEHFIEKQHILASRFKFYHTSMKPNQSHADWVAELRGAAKECDFQCKKEGCNESYLDNLIRDMVVIHTPHDKVRTSVLQKTNPSLEEVLQIASIYETTIKTCSEIKGEPNNSQNVNAIDKKYNKKNHQGNSKMSSHSNSKFNNKSTIRKSCPGCGISHERSKCFHYQRKTKCNRCSKIGHISSVCQSQSSNVNHSNSNHNNSKMNMNRQQEAVNNVKENSFESISVVNTLEPDSVQQSNVVNESHKILIDLLVNNHQIKFQIDTGASCSLIGISTYRQLGQPICQPTSKSLRGYGGNILQVKGIINVNVQWNNEDHKLKLWVVENENASNIFGLDWFEKLKFQIIIPPNDSVNNLSHFSVLGQASHQNLIASLHNLSEKYSTIFSTGLGLCSSFKAEIRLKENATPKFCKPYNLPFAQYDKVRAEINRLVALNVLKPVNSSEWAAPVVVVTKPDGKLRICADFKVSVNQQIEIDRYPIPRIEELFHKLQKGQYFTKIDLSEAYLQIELSESSKKFMTINTPFGLFQYQRMPFGIASAPGIFQKFMEMMVADSPGCAIYLDDIIITGRNNEEHLQNVKNIFEKLNFHGLKCKKEKCYLAKERVEYVGHIIDSKGISPSDKRLKNIKLMPRPQNVKELEAFIGKVNYYNKFIPNFSSKATALNELRKKNIKFIWGKSQDESFTALKDAIIKAVKLVHYNDEYPIILATDASKNGIGAVISHRYPDGMEKPIAFASKTLNGSQTSYSQIEKEALSIIFGVTRFHQYLFGRKFELTTDHQALTTLFHPCKKLPVTTLHRLQRWAIILQSYEYSIRYKNTSQHANADALSRLPIGEDLEFDQREESMMFIEQVYQTSLDELPISSNIIANQTKKDEILKIVAQYIVEGWPEKLQENQGNLKHYFNRKFSLSFQKGIVLFHSDHTRVVIPSEYQEKILTMLHEGHWGASRMKAMARRYVWFPNIDEAIQKLCQNCANCREAARNPKKGFSAWPEPEQPWQRIHLDFAGPFHNRMWMILIDAYSKFPYTVEMSTATSSTTISSLQKIFSVEGLPETIVSDNGTQFTSDEFQKFCELNCIQHLTTAPFHPASNGLAERHVRTFKEAFTKIMIDEENRERALFKYLTTFRSTPNPISNKSPAELLHGRQPRTILSALLPSNKKEAQQPNSKFLKNQHVYARNYSSKGRWIRGVIKQVIGNFMYLIETKIGSIRRHQNQLRLDNQATKEQSSGESQSSNFDIDIEIPTKDSVEIVPNLHPPENVTSNDNSSSSVEPTVTTKKAKHQIPTQPIRRSTRPQKKTIIFDPSA